MNDPIIMSICIELDLVSNKKTKEDVNLRGEWGGWDGSGRSLGRSRSEHDQTTLNAPMKFSEN